MTKDPPANPVPRAIAVIANGFIPIYRVKFYQLLNRLSDNKYIVFHGSPPSNAGHPECAGKLDFPNAIVRNYKLSLRRLTIIYQPVVTRILFGSVDAVVLGIELRFVSSLVLFALCKMVRKPVIWWGQGFEKAEIQSLTGRLISRIVGTIRRRLAGRGDMYIVYTKGGAEKLMQAGVREEKIKVIRNTIDMEDQRALYDEVINSDPLELRRAMNLRLDSKVLLYVGRLYKEKRVEEVLYLVKRLNAERRGRSIVEAVIIGDGPDLRRLQKIGAGIQDVHLIGELYDQRRIAEYMRVSSAVVIPGKVGLAVNHAFAHGVPVITRRHDYHAPEVEYIISGENGLIVDGDFSSFVSAVVAYLNSIETQRILAEGALKARETLSLEFMVKAFDEAVSKTITQKTEGMQVSVSQANRQ